MNIDWGGIVIGLIFILVLTAPFFALFAWASRDTDAFAKNLRNVSAALNGRFVTHYSPRFRHDVFDKIEATVQDQTFECSFENTGLVHPPSRWDGENIMWIAVSHAIPEQLAEINIFRKHPGLTSAKAIRRSDDLIEDAEFRNQFVIFPLMVPADEAFLKSWLSRETNRNLIKNILGADAVAIQFDYGRVLAAIPFAFEAGELLSRQIASDPNQFAAAVHRLVPQLAELANVINA